VGIDLRNTGGDNLIFIGNVKTLEQAKDEGFKASQKSGYAFVYEKALCGNMGHRHVCYRGFLERDLPEVRVMSINEWRKWRK
jgi:hypothetical protein